MEKIEPAKLFRISREELSAKAFQLRRDLIELTYRTGSGHLDTSLSLVETWLSIVYSSFFRSDPADGAWEGRDRVFLSEGHACPLQYLVNAELGYYDKDEVFATNRQPFSPFQGHTKRNLEYGFENSNGSLGIGLWQAYGAALTISQQVFCIAGDGEFEEPISIGLLTAPHYLKPVGNFTLIINHNGLAQDSAVDIGPLENVAVQYGWQNHRVNGHDFTALGIALKQSVDNSEQPSIIICDTIKGYGGDPQRANRLGSHGRPPGNEDEYKAYIAGLEAMRRA